MKPFDPTKPCQTRDGRKVRIVCTDAGGRYPVVGIIIGEENQPTAKRWASSGEYSTDGAWPENNLINIPEKRKLKGFLNTYPNGEMGIHLSKEGADRCANSDRIACLDLSKYNIEFEEGEGL